MFDFNCVFLQYETVIKIILVSLFIIVPSSIIVNKLFQDLFPKDEKGKIFDVGSIIGILERILVLIFACFGDFAAIAIIITVKTWARSGDLKGENDFRNKYLLGTLASLVLALIAFLIYKMWTIKTMIWLDGKVLVDTKRIVFINTFLLCDF